MYYKKLKKLIFNRTISNQKLKASKMHSFQEFPKLSWRGRNTSAQLQYVSHHAICGVSAQLQYVSSAQLHCVSSGAICQLSSIAMCSPAQLQCAQVQCVSSTAISQLRSQLSCKV